MLNRRISPTRRSSIKSETVRKVSSPIIPLERGKGTKNQGDDETEINFEQEKPVANSWK
jgi:hypothetical protein